MSTLRQYAYVPLITTGFSGLGVHACVNGADALTINIRMIKTKQNQTGDSALVQTKGTKTIYNVH